MLKTNYKRRINARAQNKPALPVLSSSKEREETMRLTNYGLLPRKPWRTPCISRAKLETI